MAEMPSDGVVATIARLLSREDWELTDIDIDDEGHLVIVCTEEV